MTILGNGGRGYGKTRVIKSYTEKARSGRGFTAKRLQPGKRRDFIARIARKAARSYGA